MKIEQIYTGCLAQGAYYIESNGKAAVVDPLRDIDVYLQLAAERNATINYIFETHFHADFVSGSATVGFIQNHPELFSFTERLDRGTKMLRFLADTTVNGKTFYRFNTLAPLTFMGGVEYQLADSSGYIIDPTGFVYEVNNGAQDTIRVENFSAIDVVVKTGNRDTLLNVPAGSFRTLQTIGDTYYTGMASPTGTNPRHSGNFAAKNVGCISINYFYANSPYHFCE